MRGFLARWAEGEPEETVTQTAGSGHQEESGTSDKHARVLQSEALSTAQDSLVSEARHDIAELLATAYQRYTAISRAGTDQPINSTKEDVANSCAQSVHGVVE